MFLLNDYHPFYMRSSGPNLRNNTRLRLLQVDLNIMHGDERKRKRAEWFNSVCESVTSKSLVVELRRVSWNEKICNKIQDTILALKARTETLSVYVSAGYQVRQELYLEWITGESYFLHYVKQVL